MNCLTRDVWLPHSGGGGRNYDPLGGGVVLNTLCDDYGEDLLTKAGLTFNFSWIEFSNI